jgi:surface antigen
MNKTTIAALSLSMLLTGCAEMNNQDVGTLSGGVIGGLLGSQFGSGSGKVMAAAGGALLGAYLGGRIGQTMDRQDRMEMQRALETAPTGRTVVWSNPDSGNRYTVRPVRTYYQEQQPCREYVTTALIGGKREQIHGTACRQAGGAWKVMN